jgi:ubiquinone biosynthesis UbiH/UbiF/VisC/COQ6 family hydroxylase
MKPMRNEFDVVIIGGGLVGLSLARALARSGLRQALIEPQPPVAAPADSSWDNRVYALSPGSVAFLEDGGAWQRLPRDRITRVEAMQVQGDAEDARLHFSAYDAGLRELAVIVEGRRLLQALWDGLGDLADLRIYRPAGWTSLELGAEQAELRLDDGTEIAARLVVGADGAESRVRAQAGISVRPGDYGQLGVVANFSCEKPHRGTAFQWFMRDGVLALLPLPGDRVSMVWSIAQEQGRKLLALPAAELAAQVDAASHGALGALHLITPAAGFPLKFVRVTQFTKPRVALVGDAAHNVHPLAGQGVNVGFRDARALADVLIARGPQRDCGDHALLRRYERARREDVLAVHLMTDGLQKLFNNDIVLIARARNLGLKLVNWQPLLKNFLVRQASA